MPQSQGNLTSSPAAQYSLVNGMAMLGWQGGGQGGQSSPYGNPYA